MMKPAISGVMLIAAVAISSCGSTAGMVGTHKSTGNPDMAKHLALHNSSLSGKIMISDMKLRRVDDLLQVQVVLENLTSRDKAIQYRFSWFDAQDFEIEKDSRGWTPVIIHGRDKTSMTGTGPNPSVTSYRINVRAQ